MKRGSYETREPADVGGPASDTALPTSATEPYYNALGLDCV